MGQWNMVAIYFWDRNFQGDWICQDTTFLCLLQQDEFQLPRCQRLCECGDNWLCSSVSACHKAQICCQSNILELLTFHCKIFLIILYRNCIFFFFTIVHNRGWLLRVHWISNQQFWGVCSQSYTSCHMETNVPLNVAQSITGVGSWYTGQKLLLQALDSMWSIFPWPLLWSALLGSPVCFFTLLLMRWRLSTFQVCLPAPMDYSESTCWPGYGPGTTFRLSTLLKMRLDLYPQHYIT